MTDAPISPDHPDVAAFYRAVAAAAPEHLVVEPTANGFTVTYRDAIEKAGVLWHTDTMFSASVVCDPETSLFTMEDRVARRGEHYSGLGFRASAFRGRMNAWRMVQTYEVLEDGTVGRTSKQRQSNAEIHELVRGVVAELPWVEHEPASALVGKTVAITTLVLMAIAGVAVAVLALTGNLP